MDAVSLGRTGASVSSLLRRRDRSIEPPVICTLPNECLYRDISYECATDVKLEERIVFANRIDLHEKINFLIDDHNTISQLRANLVQSSSRRMSRGYLVKRVPQLT